MTARRKPTSSGKAHRFGGDWTQTKLDVLERYLAAYTTALKDQPSPDRRFIKGYIDAFAGTGYRTLRGTDGDDHQTYLADMQQPEPQGLLDGSARIALKTAPEFERYVFIEKSPERCVELNALKNEFPHLASRITVHQGDANEHLQALCAKDWRKHRAVLFVDPYGMNVEWRTIQAVAATRAIDLWLLVPFGIGINRLLTNTGDIPPGWRARLDTFLGTPDWYDAMYADDGQMGLFDDPPRRVKARMDVVGKYFMDRLRTEFPAVATPGALRNSTNCPLYLFCFAASNERGAEIAVRIANHVLKGIQ